MRKGFTKNGPSGARRREKRLKEGAAGAMGGSLSQSSVVRGFGLGGRVHVAQPRLEPHRHADLRGLAHEALPEAQGRNRRAVKQHEASERAHIGTWASHGPSERSSTHEDRDAWEQGAAAGAGVGSSSRPLCTSNGVRAHKLRGVDRAEQDEGGGRRGL